MRNHPKKPGNGVTGPKVAAAESIVRRASVRAGRLEALDALEALASDTSSCSLAGWTRASLHAR